MPLKTIGSPHPKYLAATDILISDMSNISYDFLIYSRPIILIANKWVRENIPDFGIKTDLEGLDAAIKESIRHPERFEKQRKLWHKKTMQMPDGKSARRVIEKIIEKSGIADPFILLIHGNNDVSKVHLDPLFSAAGEKGLTCEFTGFFDTELYSLKKNLLIISTHNNILNDIKYGYRVHIDHSVKGKGVTDFEGLSQLYKEKEYYKNTDLQVTEGEISFENTKKLMGPRKDRVIMAGYPKSDTLLECNTIENKNKVYEELGLKSGKVLITYAPTGKYRYPFKQGASLSKEVLYQLKRIAKKNDYNILIKLRSKETISDKMSKIVNRVFQR